MVCEMREAITAMLIELSGYRAEDVQVAFNNMANAMQFSRKSLI
jgi:hypothetical protein